MTDFHRKTGGVIPVKQSYCSRRKALKGRNRGEGLDTSLYGITSAPVCLNTFNVFLNRCWFYDSYKCTCREFVSDGRASIYAGCRLCLEARNPQRQEKPASQQRPRV